MKLSIGAEERVLAAAIRAGGLWPGEPARPAPVIEDWPALLQSARKHNVTGLLFCALKRSGALALAPQEIREALRQAYAGTLALNTCKLGLFGRMAADLAMRNVPVVALNGSALAATLYEDAGQRVIGDLDFLVHRKHIPEVIETLTQYGFQPYETVFNAKTRDAQLGELVFVQNNGARLMVEPHWHIFNHTYFTRRVPVAWFWENTQPAQIGHQPALVLNPTAQVIHLCSHYVVHHIARPHLRWSHDIALLLARHRNEINWPAVIDSARHFNVFGMVEQVLAYVIELWDAPLTPEHHALVFGTTPTARERLIARAMNAEGARPIIDGWMAGGISDRFHYWRDVFLPNKEYMRKRYSNELRGPLALFYLRRLRNGLRRLMGVR